VAVVYGVLAVAFVAPAAVLYHEFGWDNGFALAVFECNHFVFFPALGLLALVAFYVPSVAITHLYWRPDIIWGGKWRYGIGFAVIGAIAFAAAEGMLASGPPAVWEIRPAVLEQDRGEMIDCGSGTADRTQCRRLPGLQAVLDVRAASQARIGLSRFARDCSPDRFLEAAEILAAQRQCFPAGQLLNASQCCTVQKRFSSALSEMYARPGNPSLTYRVHALTMPFKVFFLIVVLVIGVLLAWRSASLDTLYGSVMKRIELGVLVGAAAMLFWPLTYFASSQSWAVLYGWGSDIVAPASITIGSLTLQFDGSIRRNLGLAYTLALVPWALLLLFYFFRRKGMEVAARVGGVTASFFAALRHEEIIDYSVRVIGSGASHLTLIPLLIFIVVAGLGTIGSPWFQEHRVRKRRAKPELT